MLDIKNKYLKYKEKYLNLKQMIGGGINATYEIMFKPGDEIMLHYVFEDVAYEKIYKIIRLLGKGNYGIVYLIKNNDETDTKEYIFKTGITHYSTASYDEGIKSNLLEKILDKDMLVLFQGKYKSDFLISTYNGTDLLKEFKDKKHLIKDKYASITTQLLELLQTINMNDIFHNDIKLENVTIKGDKVYLIDFGLLSKLKSNMGSLWSMSYNGVIAILEAYRYIKYYDAYYDDDYYDDDYYEVEIFDTLKLFLIDTDIVGFFYCCIELLFLTVDNGNTLLKTLFSTLGISDYSKISLYKLFELFYFILPKPYRTIQILNNNSNYYNDLLPSEKETNIIFSDFPDEHINLFRFMAYIYKKIDDYKLIKNEKQQIWYANFLKIMSACFLPDFNYEKFKIQFNAIVLEFSKLPELPDGSAPTSDYNSLYMKQIADWKRSAQEMLTVIINDGAQLSPDDIINLVKVVDNIPLIFNGLDSGGRMLFSPPDSKNAELLVNRNPFVYKGTTKISFAYAWMRLQSVQEMLTVIINDGAQLSPDEVINTVELYEDIPLIFNGLDSGGRMLFSAPDSEKAKRIVKSKPFVRHPNKFIFKYAYPREDTFSTTR